MRILPTGSADTLSLAISQIAGTNVLVLHLTCPGHEPFPDLTTALRAACNAAAEMPGVQIKILVGGRSVNQLIKGEPAREIVGRPISIYAYEYSLRSAKIDPSILYAGVMIIPAAVPHIVERVAGTPTCGSNPRTQALQTLNDDLRPSVRKLSVFTLP